MIYTERPKQKAARVAWDVFTKAMDGEPADMSWGHGSDYGWNWTAENKAGLIYVWMPTWDRAICGSARRPSMPYCPPA